MYNLNRKLEELEVQGKSIKIAIIGAGHMGTGMVSQVVNMKGMIPSIVADINVDLAKASFTKAGIAEDQIVIVEDEKAAEAAIQEGKYVACKSLQNTINPSSSRCNRKYSNRSRNSIKLNTK